MKKSAKGLGKASPSLMDAERAALDELKRRLEKALGPKLKRYVLYGSRARGDPHDESDIDVAVVVKDLTNRQKNKILDAVAEIEIHYLCTLSTMVISLENFDRLKERERRIALDIEKEGIPL